MIIVIYLTALFSSVVGLLPEQCLKTPFFKLNLCQIDCNKCGINALCEECPANFNLTQSKCEPNTNIVYHLTYFNQPQITSKTIDQKQFKISNQFFTEQNIVRICQSNAYKFDMMGLFAQQNRLSFNMNFDTPVTQITIKFHFLTVFNNTKLQVILNGDQIHQVIYNNSGINHAYQKGTNSINFLQIPALKQSSASSIINKVSIGPFSFSEDRFNKNNELRLEITYLSNTSSTDSFWGFSDFSIVGKKCQDCLPERLKTLSSNVGIAIGISAGVLIILILIMLGCVKVQQRKRLSWSKENVFYDMFSQEQEKQQENDEKQNELRINQSMKKTIEMSSNSKKNKAQ